MKVLNLYAGVGGNRKHWKDVEVTAVERDENIASVYKKLNPDDHVVVGDAHQYLLQHSNKYEFIWSSPPCQSHSKMHKANARTSKKYPDMSLYQEIIYLKHFFKGLWVVENVIPYYTPLIQPQKIGRHLFWCNFDITFIRDVPRPKNFINKQNLKEKETLMDWLGIYYKEKLYYEGNHCVSQVLRNCVHPELGLDIFNKAMMERESLPLPNDVRG